MGYMIALIVALAATIAMTTTQAQDVFYRLSLVTTDEQAVACGKAGGKGALVFSIDENGMTTSAPEPHCLTLVK